MMIAPQRTESPNMRPRPLQPKVIQSRLLHEHLVHHEEVLSQVPITEAEVYAPFHPQIKHDFNRAVTDMPHRPKRFSEPAPNSQKTQLNNGKMSSSEPQKTGTLAAMQRIMSAQQQSLVPVPIPRERPPSPSPTESDGFSPRSSYSLQPSSLKAQSISRPKTPNPRYDSPSETSTPEMQPMIRRKNSRVEAGARASRTASDVSQYIMESSDNDSGTLQINTLRPKLQPNFVPQIPVPSSMIVEQSNALSQTRSLPVSTPPSLLIPTSVRWGPESSHPPPNQPHNQHTQPTRSRPRPFLPPDSSISSATTTTSGTRSGGNVPTLIQERRLPPPSDMIGRNPGPSNQSPQHQHQHQRTRHLPLNDNVRNARPVTPAPPSHIQTHSPLMDNNIRQRHPNTHPAVQVRPRPSSRNSTGSGSESHHSAVRCISPAGIRSPVQDLLSGDLIDREGRRQNMRSPGFDETISVRSRVTSPTPEARRAQSPVPHRAQSPGPQRAQSPGPRRAQSPDGTRRESAGGRISVLAGLFRRPRVADPIDIGVIRAQPLFNNPRIVDKNGDAIRCDFGWEERGIRAVGDILDDNGFEDYEAICSRFDPNVHAIVKQQLRLVMKAIPSHWLQLVRDDAKARKRVLI